MGIGFPIALHVVHYRATLAKFRATSQPQAQLTLAEDTFPFLQEPVRPRCRGLPLAKCGSSGMHGYRGFPHCPLPACLPGCRPPFWSVSRLRAAGLVELPLPILSQDRHICLQ